MRVARMRPARMAIVNSRTTEVSIDYQTPAPLGVPRRRRMRSSPNSKVLQMDLGADTLGDQSHQLGMLFLIIIMFVTIGLALRAGMVGGRFSPADVEAD